MILVDTSAWVEYDRATASAVDLRLTELIASDGPIAITEPVIMEVLSGARSDEREEDLRRLLLRFHLHHFDATTDFDGAVRIYRRLRIPSHSVHPFRSNPYTDSDVFVHPLRRLS